MLIALTEGHWEYAADTAKFDDLAYQLLSDIEGDWPVYAVVDDGLNQRIWPCSVPMDLTVPTVQIPCLVWKNYVALIAWSVIQPFAGRCVFIHA